MKAITKEKWGKTLNYLITYDVLKDDEETIEVQIENELKSEHSIQIENEIYVIEKKFYLFLIRKYPYIEQHNKVSLHHRYYVILFNSINYSVKVLPLLKFISYDSNLKF
jgi:hypothetical protein